MTLESSIDPEIHAQILELRRCKIGIKTLTQQLSHTYTSIDDLTGNTMSMFALDGFIKTNSFLNRLEKVCEKQIEVLSSMGIKDVLAHTEDDTNDHKSISSYVPSFIS